MFPSIQIQVEDLDPLAHYCLVLEMMPATHCRFKYSNSTGWAPAGIEEAQSNHRIYVHPESPATGEYWMSQIISFGRVKLTNTISPPVGHLVLSSMHKYQPKIVLVKTTHLRFISWSPSKTCIFPETEFIAVTAYQNERITKLKIDNNPFAKGFREGGHSKCKRKLSDLNNEQEEEIIVVDDESAKKVCKEEDRVSVPEATTQNFSYIPPWAYPAYRFSTSNPFVYYSPHLLVPSSAYNYTQVSPLSPNVPKSVTEKPKKLTDFSIRAITGQS